MTSSRFRWIAVPELLYALAFLGAHIAFMPLFVLLLPRRVEAVAGTGSVSLLSSLLLIGGIVASVAHIAAGAASDRWFARFGNRRGLIAIGVAALCAAYISLAAARTAEALLLAVPAFQVSLNLMFAPLGAILSDHIDDSRKGRVAALMNIALPVSGLATAFVAVAFPRDGAGGFLAIGGAAALAVAPLLLAWPFGRSTNAAPDSDEADPSKDPSRLAVRDYGFVWGARLLVQTGAAFLLNYFYLFVAERADMGADVASRAVGALAGAAMIASVAGALAAGTFSDRRRVRRAPMIAGTLVVVAAFALLLVGTSWPFWASGYVLFNLGLTVFLSIDSAMVAQLVAPHARRGELLGYMNLTNTLPNILVPSLALGATIGGQGFRWELGFGASLLLALVAGTFVARIRAIR